MRKGMFIILLALFTTSGAFAGWVKEDIDTGSGGASIVLDSSDNPHVAYGGIKYGYRDGSGWHIETIDSGDYPELALDSQDRPHISYRSGDNLKYAYYDGYNWNIEILDTGDYESSMIIDNDDYPHIVHYEYGIGLRYVYKDSTGWHIYLPGENGYSALMVQDTNGDRHFSYKFHNGYNSEVIYARFDGYNWESEYIDELCLHGGGTAIAVNEDNEPGIAYGSDPLKFAQKDGNDWTIQTIDGMYVNPISMVNDSTYNLHLVYCKSVDFGYPGDLKYRLYNGSSWQTDLIESDKEVFYTDICTDTSNYPHVFYNFDDMNKSDIYRYAYWDPNVGIDDDTPTTPTGFALSPAYPNPSSGNATIGFALPHACAVNLEVFDIKGRKVATLAEGEYPAGEYERGVSGLSSGVYLYRLTADEFADTKKMVVK